MTEATFQKILRIPIDDMSKYSAGDLCHLWQDSGKELVQARKAKNWIEAAISLKYQEFFLMKRLRLGKQTGMVHIEDDDIRISCDIPKKVQWQQDKLEEIAGSFEARGVDSKEYIKVIYSVPEKYFSSWPVDVQKLFEPARKFGVGNPNYELVELDDLEVLK